MELLATSAAELAASVTSDPVSVPGKMRYNIGDESESETRPRKDPSATKLSQEPVEMGRDQPDQTYLKEIREEIRRLKEERRKERGKREEEREEKNIMRIRKVEKKVDKTNTNWVKVKIGDTITRVFTDSGSDANVIPPKMYRKGMGKIEKTRHSLLSLIHI